MKKIISKFWNHYKKANVAVKASLWFALCSILQKGISIITMPIFTRLMDTSEYGEYTIFQTWYNILIIIVTLNVQSEIFNKGLIENQDEKNAFTANQAGLLIVLSAIFSTVYFIFHPFINRFMGLSTFLMFVMIGEILGNALIALWSARKRFEFDYKKIVTVTLLTSVLNPIVGIVAVSMAENKVQARIISNALVPICVSMILLVGIKRGGSLCRNIQWWKTAVVTSLPLLPHYLSLVLLNQSDKLMINQFVGTEEAAIYSVAHSAGLLMTIVNTSINGSFVPWAYGKMKNEHGIGIKKISSLLFGLVMGVNICLIWFAPEAVQILAAPQYGEAKWCLVPIAASVYFFFVYTLFVDIEIYFGANKYIAIASVIAAILNLILNYIFIPIYGYIAAGYTTLFSYFATMVMHYCFLRKTLKKNQYGEKLFDEKMIAFWGILMVVTATIAMVLYGNMVIRFFIAIIIAIIIFWKKNYIMEIMQEIKKRSER